MNLKKGQNYNRVVTFLKECPNKLTLYPELKEDLKFLCTPEVKENIKLDLPQILPGVLVLSAVTEESVVQEIVSLFSVINDIVSSNVSLKTEPWWREMENNIVPNKFCSGLTALIEKNSEFWAQIWIFAVSLMINDTQLQGSTVNSLLKIMEVAFKKSLSDTTTIMDKAFFCWIKFIEIFTSNPRILHSKKLIGLLVRPLTIPMGPKSHIKIIQTYKLIFEKVGKTEDKSIVIDIINSFIQYSYMKNGDSFSKTHPNECCETLLELINEKNTFRKMYILPVLSVLTHCVENCSNVVDINDYEQYLKDIISQRQKLLKNNEILKGYEAFREHLKNRELPIISPELLNKLLISNSLSPKILADLLEYKDFRTKTLATYFKQFINNINSEGDKKETSCAKQMEAWDTLCAAFNLFVNSETYELQEIDPQIFKPLILLPLKTHAKVSKLHRKLITDLKADKGDKIKESKTPSPKVRSPLMTGSNFLHRLAKSEEKKAVNVVSLGLGDRNIKTTLKTNRDNVESNKCPNSNEKVSIKDKEKEDTNIPLIKEEVTLPKTVNIIVTNNIVNNVNNVPIIKTPEDNLKLVRTLQNGDCRFSSSTKKSSVTTKTSISYFEDDTQVKTPLTEHQKEKLTQRKSDIPALYQDLSQDTQSISSLLDKNTPPEVVVTMVESKKTLNSEGKKSDNAEQADRSLDVIEVTPPAQNLLTTPTKSSPHLTASKKLNFEGLVKANSPVPANSTLKEFKNNLEENCINTPSRRISNRKTTSKYGVNRVITPTKDSDDISGISLLIEGLNKKNFVKQERSSKKLKQKEYVSVDNEELSVRNEKCEGVIKEAEDSKSISETNLAKSFAVDCVEQQEKESRVEQNKSKLDVSKIKEEGDGIINGHHVKADAIQDIVELSVNINQFHENGQSNGHEKSKHAVIGESKKVREKSDLLLSNNVEICKPMLDEELIQPTQVKEIVETNKSSQAERIINPTTKAREEGSPCVAGGQDDKSEQSSSEKIVGDTTPSQKIRRRRRKLPPSPFSPKLTRSKKLSLQGKDKSPKSPKEPKTKIRAPKPNTESFSSDSNDSLTGITSLEKIIDTTGEQVAVNNLLKKIEEENSITPTNEQHITKAKVQIITETKSNEENVSEKHSLEECNENSEPIKTSRKRKMQSLPGENDHNTSDLKTVNSLKKRKQRRTLGISRVNSNSPRLASGLEHWLYKKNKTPAQKIDINKEAPVKKEDEISENTTNTAAVVLNSNKNETNSTEASENVEVPVKEKIIENKKPKESLSDRIENPKRIQQAVPLEECDTEIIPSEEMISNDSQNLELFPNEIIACSQDIEDSDSIFSSALKKAKLKLLNEMSTGTISNIPSKKELPEGTIEVSSSDKLLTDCSKANEISPTVTEVEKLANGMKACDLILKGIEVEKNIIIYVEEPSIAATEDIEMTQMENEKHEVHVETLTGEDVATLSSQNEELSLESDLSLNNEKAGRSTAVSEMCKSTEQSENNLLLTTPSEVVQMISNCNDSIIIPDKSTENIKTIELDKNIILITSDVKEPASKMTEKSCPAHGDFIGEIKPNNESEQNQIDIEMLKSGTEDNVSPDKLNTEKLLEISSSENQNDSEHLFKTDTPKKRGARFIHTTEKEEDGGDNAEDRRRRNFRLKRITLDDRSSLTSSGRSKHMIQLAQQGQHSRISTPRRRPNIVPITYGSNWPTGPTEEWVGIRPSTPGTCVSPGILKPSPVSSPANSIVSPPAKKKRVNFLDPPVSTGLLYQKGSKIGIGQLQYAETSPSKKRLLIREEEEVNTEKKIKIHADDEGKELEPAVEIEISSDESIEMLQVAENEISDNISLNEAQNLVSLDKESIGKSENLSANTKEVITEKTSENSLEKLGEIPENTFEKSEISSDNCNIQFTSTSKEVEESLSFTKVLSENSEMDINEDLSEKIPSEQELKLYVNDDEFLNNLAACLNTNGEPLSWLQRLLTLVVVGAKK
uniref:Telomere-associated protein Rif1 N-terminal domain-containing protein n=1 Tax=Rhodnius prolixus TaxID=13249 RepID=T1HZ08_RHOPR